MKDAIVEKLTERLSVAPQTEAQVAYALVEIRKYLEREGKKDNFKELVFFCDWVVHVELSGKGAQNALGILDERLATLDLSDLSNIGYSREMHRFIHFEVLLEELTQFLAETGMPDLWVRTPAHWATVKKLYAEIVRDCALSLRQTDGPGMHLKRVVLEVVSPNTSEFDKQSFQLVWGFTLTDGRSFSLNAFDLGPSRDASVWGGAPTNTTFGID